MAASKRRILYIRAILVGALLCIALGVYAAIVYERTTPQLLSVTFFDVGQGDAIFIESPTGTQVLIDGGPDTSVLRALGDEMGFLDRTIDIVLATHEDADHIGGLPDVFERYKVATVIDTEQEGESTTARAFREAAVREGEVVSARRGMVYDLGGGAMLSILFPERDPSQLPSNTSSIIARLEYGEHAFLFTGDAPRSIEEYLVNAGAIAESEVVKVGHHGSRTSTSKALIEAAAPQYGIISAGADNRYGHPHEEVLATLDAYDVIPKNTAEEGSITFVSDGENLLLK